MLVSTARTLRRLLHRQPTVHLVYRNPRSSVIENGGPFFNARRSMSFDQLEPRPAARDLELDFAAGCNAQGFPNPFRDGDLPLARDRYRDEHLPSNTK